MTIVRPEPLRRRVRGQLLRGLTRTAGVVPTPMLTRTLEWATRVAPIGRYSARTTANLELALGDEISTAGRREIAAGVRRHSARLLAEWTRLGRGPREARQFLERHVEVDASLSILDEVLSAGRGALIVTAHHGNWECLAAMLALRGYAGDVVGRTRAHDSTHRWLVDMRRTYGVETFPQDGPPRRLLEGLRAGRVLGLLSDLEVRRLDGVFAPFLGHPALTMTAPAALARATGLPLVPAVCVADGPVYRLMIEEPLELDRSLDRRTATLDLCTRMNASFERWIRAAPEQWAWHQPRWRTQPDADERTHRPRPQPRSVAP